MRTEKLIAKSGLRFLIGSTALLTLALGTYVFITVKNIPQTEPVAEFTQEKFEEIVRPVPNQVVISFAPEATEEQKKEYIESIGGTVSSNLSELNSVVVNVEENIATEDLPKSNIVAKGEENYFVTALGTNDPEYSKQWALPVIKAEELWETTSTDKIVAVIDSGICASHPDLQGKVLAGYDFVEGDSDPQDSNGHGCGVSGIIAANINNGIGMAGVSKNAKIMPLKVLDNAGLGTYANVASAIVYAANNGADIINLSLGGVNASSILESAVNYAKDKGVTIVAASGNTGSEGVLYPAAYPYVIAVGSVNEQLEQSSFTSYGPNLDILAPGERILTTSLDGGYKYVNGTSFAAPVVSGVLTVRNSLEIILENQVVVDVIPDEEILDGNVNIQQVLNFTNSPASLAWIFRESTWADRNNELLWHETPNSGHTGIDANAQDWNYGYGTQDAGKSVYAPFNGRVIIARCEENAMINGVCSNVSVPSYGNTVVIESTENSSYRFRAAHLQAISVTEGQDVIMGVTELGTVGNTGFGGTHLHINFYRNGLSSSFQLNADELCGISDTNLVAVYKRTGCQKVISDYIGLSFLQYLQRNWRNLKDDQPSGFEDQIKSIKISSGYSVKLYQHYLNYGDPGYTICLSSSVNNLDSLTFPGTSLKVGEHISSFKVFSGTGCTEPPTSCTAANELATVQTTCNPGSPGDGGTTNQGDSSDFISDITIPDGQVMPPNTSFTKIWRMKNNGTTTWNSGYKLVFQSGSRMSAPTEVTLNQNVAPGANIDLAVGMVAPNVEGTYRGTWILKNGSGAVFGDLIWVEIQVQNGSTTPPDTGSGLVKLYDNANYGNLLGSYGVGDTNAPDARANSMEIPTGWSVITYRQDNYSGMERCWYQSVPNLEDYDDWQNKIQSMRVFNYNACGGSGNTVKMYSLANYQNFIGEYGPGRTDGPNNNSKSMSIPSGWSVITYRGNNYEGGSRCWSESVHDLESFDNWQYDIDSMEVFPTNVCPVSVPDHIKLCSGFNLTGTCITITEDVEKLSTTAIGDNNLKSWQLGGSWQISIFEHDTWQGQKFVTASTAATNYDQVPMPWGQDSSSIRVRKHSPGRVTLYERRDYNGLGFATDRSLQDMSNWKLVDFGESIKIQPGYEAVICTNWYGHGLCGRTKVDKADINDVAQGLSNSIGSIQVCETQCPPPAVVPVLTSPLDQTSFLPGSSIAFAWSGDGKEYMLEVSGGGLSAPLTTGWIHNSSTWTINNLPTSNNPYYWRVRGYKLFGESAYSAKKSFFIKDIEINQAYLFGNEEVDLNQEVTINAYINPTDATNVTYTWSPAPFSGQGTASPVYKFSEYGVYDIALNVKNSSSNVTIQKPISVKCPASKFTADYFNGTSLANGVKSRECLDDISMAWGAGGPKDVGLPTGNGQDGSLVISTNTTDAPIDSTASGTKNTFVLNATNSGFAAGQKILIHQTQGQSGVGVHQINEIVSYTPGTITLKYALNDSYATDTGNKAQVLVVKQYKNVIINAGSTWTAKPWNGTTGGILYFFANGTTTINGSINAAGAQGTTSTGISLPINAGGFRGGRGASNGQGGNNSHQGEGTIWTGGISSAAKGNGGGAGTGDDHQGGGGGHATAGLAGTAGGGSWGANGAGGAIVGDANLSLLIFGGGGGGGTEWANGARNSSGSNGGGIIGIASNYIVLGNSSQITVKGGNSTPDGDDNKGNGSAGAGGSIKIFAIQATLGTNRVIASGGTGANFIPTYAGGAGRIALQYCDAYSGQTSPAMNISLGNCNKDNFSARFTKTQDFTAGNYKFTTTADDGVKVWLDGELIIDDWTDGLSTNETTVFVSSGQHQIKVEYYESTGNAQIQLGIEQLPVENETPVIVGEIQSQSISGDQLVFTPFDLDDYVTDDGVVTWTITGQTELVVNKSAENVVTISRPSISWVGEEILTFTATDEYSESAATTASFTAIDTPNNTPVITGQIPSQVISGTDMQFTPFDLDDYGTDDGPVTWSISGYSSLIVSKDAQNVVTVRKPSVEWYGEETLTFKITDEQGAFATTTANFKTEEITLEPEASHIGWLFKKSTWNDKTATYGGITYDWTDELEGSDGGIGLFHNGSDYYAQDWNWGMGNDDCGLKVTAPISGKVIFAGTALGYGKSYGKQVIIRSNANKTFAWRGAHLEDISVVVGQTVSKGSVIGTVGKSGVANSCHLLSVLYKNIDKPINSTYKALDLLKVGNALGGKFSSVQNPPDQFAAAFNHSGIVGEGVPSACATFSAAGIALFSEEECIGKKKKITTLGYTRLSDIGFDLLTKSIYVPNGWSVRIQSLKGLNVVGGTLCISNTTQTLTGLIYSSSGFYHPVINEYGNSTIRAVRVYNVPNCGLGTEGDLQAESDTTPITGSEDISSSAQTPIQTQPVTVPAPIVTQPTSTCTTFSTNGVVLFNTAECTGANKKFKSPGFTKLSDIEFNNKTMSMYVPAGWSVKVHDKGNGLGASKCISKTINNFADKGYSDKSPIIVSGVSTVSAIQVYPTPTCQ